MLRVAAVFIALLAMLSCGPKSISARREHSQRIADQADEELAGAERSMGELDAAAAEKQIAEAKKVLQDPDAQLYPEYEMLLGRAKEDEAKLPEVRRARELKDLQGAVTKQREKLEEQAARLKKAVKALEAASIDKAIAQEANDAAGGLIDVLQAGIDLETKDKAYNDFAKKQRELFEKSKEAVALSRARVEFMEGPCALREQAAEKLKAGKAAKKDDDKRAAFAEAKKLYEACQDACRKALTTTPAVSRLPIMASGKKTTPEALDTACSAEWQDVDKAEKKLKPPKEEKKKKK